MNELVFRVSIPVWVEDNDTFDVDGYCSEEALEHVVGFDRENEQVVWDIDPILGRVLNWNGMSVHFFDKVRDAGTYALVVNNRVVREIEDYVPDFCCIGEDSYGDYMKFDVNADGTINGWTTGHTSAFFEYFGIIAESTVKHLGGIDRWFEDQRETAIYNGCDISDDNSQAIDMNTILLREDGQTIEIRDLINSYFSDDNSDNVSRDIDSENC